MIDLLRYYVEPLCFIQTAARGLPAPVMLGLDYLAGTHAVPVALVLLLLALWFEGRTLAERAANQLTVLRGLLSALLAWGAAAAIGLAWQQALRTPGLEQAASDWACWHGPPSASTAAAIGFALGATAWRRDRRWGGVASVVVALWAVSQVCCGRRYPLDVVVGTAVGTGLAWFVGSVTWLGRPLNALIRLGQRMMLA